MQYVFDSAFHPVGKSRIFIGINGEKITSLPKSSTPLRLTTCAITLSGVEEYAKAKNKKPLRLFGAAADKNSLFSFL